MDTQALHDFYLRYVDLLNARDFERLHEFVHDEVTQNGAPGTRDDMAAALREHTQAIPDLVWDVQELVIEGNRIAARLRDTGTPEKEWFGLAPTGASVTFDECAFYEVRDGRLAHTWYMMDAEAVRQQLACDWLRSYISRAFDARVRIYLLGMRIAGSVALVTGASRGIGAEFVRQLQ